MTPDEYVKNAVRTESPAQGVIDSKRLDNEFPNKENLIIHMKETVEVLQQLDIWKKFIFYGKNKEIIESLGWADDITGENAEKSKNTVVDETFIRVLHGASGVATEAGELFEALLKYVNGEKLDLVNLSEEIGDAMWYIGILCDTLGVSLEQVMEKNIAKLKARYPNKFSEEKAINRDLVKEREILEK